MNVFAVFICTSLFAMTAPFTRLAYVAFIGQSLGMFLWFKVLAKGPMEKIAMVQLLQPFVTLIGAIILLGEVVTPITWVVATLVALCVAGINHEKMRK